MSTPDAPVPILAEWIAAGPRARVTFDLALQPSGGLDRGNWFVRYGGNRYDISSATAALNRVLLVLSGFGVADPGPDVVSYSPPPHDVTGITGAPVLPFAGYPLVPE